MSAIPDEAIEAAAATWYRQTEGYHIPDWWDSDDMNGEDKDVWRADARAALVAALPALRAQWEAENESL